MQRPSIVEKDLLSLGDGQTGSDCHRKVLVYSQMGVADTIMAHHRGLQIHPSQQLLLRTSDLKAVHVQDAADFLGQFFFFVVLAD